MSSNRREKVLFSIEIWWTQDLRVQLMDLDIKNKCVSICYLLTCLLQCSVVADGSLSSSPAVAVWPPLQANVVVKKQCEICTVL